MLAAVGVEALQEQQRGAHAPIAPQGREHLLQLINVVHLVHLVLGLPTATTAHASSCSLDYWGAARLDDASRSTASARCGERALQGWTGLPASPS